MRTIHQIVFGSNINDLVNTCLKSWNILKNDGFEIVKWNESKVLKFLEKYYQFALPAYEGSRNLAEASDLARYLIIYHFGGCYVDWDIQLIHPPKFTALIENNKEGFLILDPQTKVLSCECFFLAPGNPFLLYLAREIVNLFDEKIQIKLLTPQYSGPFRLTESYNCYKNPKPKQILLEKIFAYTYEEIRLMPERDIRQPLIHYWSHLWLS
ncbi:glycosyltransferase family 32 protein [Niabella sp. CJ426]|uniref:glycosyltransferase family 32 protein n=1 Tax=Niabella sp. CJ426 TaxID=3393740 RepID=UPI003D0510ED